jgi:putative ABC transport system permease protein
MRRFRAWFVRLGGIVSKQPRERELNEELESHLHMHIEDNLRAGMSHDEARRQALLKLGGLEQAKESYCDRRSLPMIETLIQDIRYGLRQLRRNPSFTAVAVLTLALGIGANTAIFSAVNALLLNPYPFPEPDRILWADARHVSGKNSGAGYRDFLDWREQNDVFEEMAIVPGLGAFTLTGHGEPQRIFGGGATYGFLRVLGVQPVIGRFFSVEEDKPSGARVAVLTYAAWQQRFRGRSDILGQTMTLDGEPYTIIGVMPSGFAFPGIRTCEFFLPLQESPLNGRFQHQYSVIGRLKAGITLERAQSDMNVIASRLERQYPETNTGWRIELEPLPSAIAKEAGRPVLLLFSAVAFVLLLACMNVAGLLLARASARAKEIAVRASLGASRLRIIRQILTESVLLSIAGGALGLLFAQWVMNVLRGVAPKDFALDATLRLNSTILLFTLVVAIFTGIVFGLAPALVGSKSDLNAALKGDPNAWSGARPRGRLLSGLVAAEVALSLVLLVGAGLLVKSLFRALHVDTGLRIEHVLTFALDLPDAKYRQRTTAFYRELLDRLHSSPGIDAAAAVMTLPMTGAMTGGAFQIEGRPKAPDWVDTMVEYNITTPGFFRALGVPLLRGRDFDVRDTPASLPVAVINDALAHRFFPNEDPIGRRYKDGYDGKWRTIVGIVASYKHQQPTRDAFATTYSPFAQSPSGFMWITVRAHGDAAKIAPAVRGVVTALDRDLPVLKFETMRQIVADSLSEAALLAWFLASFAAFALLLAGIGVYGIIAYSVTQRMREMGIRVALGASPSDVFGLVLRKAVLLATIGVAVGIPAALALSRVMGSLLYGVSPRDLSIFASVPVLLVLAALAASYIPARRATKVDPMAALRWE